MKTVHKCLDLSLSFAPFLEWGLVLSVRGRGKPEAVLCCAVQKLDLIVTVVGQLAPDSLNARRSCNHGGEFFVHSQAFWS
jgi:hypothetical protein